MKMKKIGFTAGVEQEIGVTEIVCVVDKSGSMASRLSDALGGFNTFLAQQKKLPGKARFSLALFDSPESFALVYDGVDIGKAKPLTEATYVPGGCTALLDAVGRTICALKTRLGAMAAEEKPQNVVFVILTDGEENSSREFTLDGVRKLIDERIKTGWEFHYLGVDVDGFAAAQSMNMAYAGFKGPGSMHAACADASRKVSTKRGFKEDPGFPS